MWKFTNSFVSIDLSLTVKQDQRPYEQHVRVIVRQYDNHDTVVCTQ